VIRVETSSRWDAVALARRLPDCDCFYLQLAPDRWLVTARPRVGGRRAVTRALQGVEAWLRERGIDSAQVSVDDRPYTLVAAEEAQR
jgi:hypothetical protein